MQYLIRVNGGTILYGILRGEIAAFTGSFPGGKFNLPTVNMMEIVKDCEEKLKQKHFAETSKEKKPIKKPRKKSVTSETLK
jgi:hypothetical protein